MNKTPHSLCLLTLVLALGACAGGTSSSSQQAKKPVSTLNPPLESNAIDRAMQTALAQAEASGDKQEVLAILGEVHRRNPKDAAVAARYARALREDEQINAAIRTLQPFTVSGQSDPESLTEMAMSQLALGDYAAAEAYASRAITMSPKNARAYLALGTAQDAQGEHQKAEVSFREGVKYWRGDASPILNNLALNLASQGHLEESLALIKKAQKMSPNRVELERNRRIIATLLETTGPRPPAPDSKPPAGAEADKVSATVPSQTVAPTPPKKAKPAKIVKPTVAVKPKPVPKQAVKKESAKPASVKAHEQEPAAGMQQAEKKTTYKQGKTSTTSNIKLKPVQ